MKPLEKKYKWHKIADNINEFDFAESNLTEINVAGKTILMNLQMR